MPPFGSGKTKGRSQIGIMVDEDLRAAIAARAKAQRETASVVVRRALREAFAPEITDGAKAAEESGSG